MWSKFSTSPSFPNLIGCMVLKDDPNDFIEFYIGPKTGTKLPYISRYSYSKGKEKEFTISVGNAREIEIYGVSKETASRHLDYIIANENLGTLKVFEISKKEANPFSDIYGGWSSNLFISSSCEFLTNNKSPIKTISIQ